MKKAYMIFAYNDANKVKRLIDALDYNCDFYIHVDKKVDIKKFEDVLIDKKNCFFTKNRYRVAWGGWSQVQAIMEMLISAYESGISYSHIILITETDYPIKSNKEIEDYLEKHLDTEFVMAFDITTHNHIRKVNRAWWFDYPINNRLIHRILCIIGNRIVLPFFHKDTFCFLQGNKIHPYCGQMLFGVTPSCSKYIIDIYKNDKRFNSYMKTVYVPCEFYYQTIIFNSKFKKNTCQHGEEHIETPDFSWAPLHYYDYSKPKIKVYNIDDFDELNNSGMLFFRKAICGESDLLMDKIDLMRSLYYK